jgi:hypothetical protein
VLHICDQNFSSAFALKKTPKSFILSTLSTHVKENERNGQDYQKYALFVPFLRLFFSPSLSLFCSHAALSSRSYSFSLSFRAAFVRAFVCARLCVSSGLIFVSEFCFHLNHKFSSRALSRADFVSSLYHLASSFHSVCCIGAGYVGGPTMAMIALKCPHIEVMNIFL